MKLKNLWDKLVRRLKGEDSTRAHNYKKLLGKLHSQADDEELDQTNTELKDSDVKAEVKKEKKTNKLRSFFKRKSKDKEMEPDISHSINKSEIDQSEVKNLQEKLQSNLPPDAEADDETLLPSDTDLEYPSGEEIDTGIADNDDKEPSLSDLNDPTKTGTKANLDEDSTRAQMPRIPEGTAASLRFKDIDPDELFGRTNANKKTQQTQVPNIPSAEEDATQAGYEIPENDYAPDEDDDSWDEDTGQTEIMSKKEKSLLYDLDESDTYGETKISKIIGNLNPTRVFKKLKGKKTDSFAEEEDYNPFKDTGSIASKTKLLSLDGVKLAFDKIFSSNASKSLFDPHNRGLLHATFIKAFFLCSAYTLGKVGALMLRGTQVPPQPSVTSISAPNLNNLAQQISTLEQKNYFNAKLDSQAQKPIPTVVATNVPCESAKQKTSLPYTLISTIVLQDEVKSVAAVQVRGESTNLHLRKGDKIKSQAKIDKIERLRVILKNLSTGTCEYLDKPATNDISTASKIQVVSPAEGKKLMDNAQPKGIKNEGNDFKICGSYMDEKLQNMSGLLTEAKGEPFPNPDGSLSFKLSQVKAGGIFSHLGVQNDDIITMVNGNKIRSIAEVMNLFGNISQLANLSLTLKREGEEISLDYQFDRNPDCEKGEEL